MPQLGKPILFIVGPILLLTSCFSSHESQAERERNANTAAGKTGKAAHYVAKESGKAARAAGRKLAQAAREARDGWEESAHQDQQKAKQ